MKKKNQHSQVDNESHSRRGALHSGEIFNYPAAETRGGVGLTPPAIQDGRRRCRWRRRRYNYIPLSAEEVADNEASGMGKKTM